MTDWDDYFIADVIAMNMEAGDFLRMNSSDTAELESGVRDTIKAPPMWEEVEKKDIKAEVG